MYAAKVTVEMLLEVEYCELCEIMVTEDFVYILNN